MSHAERRVVVCHVPGLDLRDVSEEKTPTIFRLMREYNSIELETLPGPDLAPCLLTGTYPHQNRVWQVSFLPYHPSERGFMVVADESVRPNREKMTLIDFAPTMLAYFGEEVPAYMAGDNVLDG